MEKFGPFCRWYGIPVLVSLAVLAGLNEVWHLPAVEANETLEVLYCLAVTLVGSAVALIFLWLNARASRIARDDLGVNPSGWTACRRLGGLVAIAAYLYWGFAAHLPPTPSSAHWGDLGFWFVMMMSSSLAELLVFVGVGFALLERGLRTLGMSRLLSTPAAAAFAAVTFGLYHFTHGPHWYASVVPLMGEMFLVVVFFWVTRNFYLTFVLHNLHAAVAFTLKIQIRPDAQALVESFTEFYSLLNNLTAFGVPFLLLLALEWKGWREPRAAMRSAPP